MELYKHNADAVDSVLKHFEHHKKAAVVHATGTGKSYIIGAVAEKFERVLVVAPNNFVLGETRKVCHKGCEFRTYASVMYDEGDAGKYDLIVLDEFHRSGAERWGDGVRNLINANPDAYLLGTSATHIRYLDGARNMADEIFDGDVVSYLPLREAIGRGILPNPTYVSSIYSMDDTLASRQRRYSNSHKAGVDVCDACRKLERIAGNWENAGGVPKIIRKYFSHDMQRVIVFCSKIKRAAEARALLSEWFGKAGFKRVRYYNIDYKEKRLESEMEDFQAPLGEYDLKVAISVNMLNEGVHIPHVDGVVMLRSTISRIIIEQQVGRCLTADNCGITPVVLDLVNNVDSIRYDDFCVFGESDGSSEDAKSVRGSGFPFDVIDEVRDLRILLKQLDDEVCSYTFEECRQEALKYQRRIDFQKNSLPYYRACRYYGWLKEVTAHMPIRNCDYTKDYCIDVALSCASLKDFRENEYSVYSFAYRNGWLDEIKDLIVKPVHTDEEVLDAVSKCKNMKEFMSKHPALYTWACRHGKRNLIDTLPRKVIVFGRTDEDCVEVAKKYRSYKEFKENERVIYCFLINNHKIDLLRDIFPGQIPRRNVDKSYDVCRELAKSCSTRTEFGRKYKAEYTESCKNGWINDFFPGEFFAGGRRRKPYTKEEVLEVAGKCENRHQFIREHKNEYEACRKLGLMDELNELLPVKQNIKYTYDECKEVVSKYTRQQDFSKENNRLFRYIKNKGWDDILEPLEKRAKSICVTKEEAMSIISKYTTFADFMKNEARVQMYIRKKPWYNEVTAPLVRSATSHTFEECKESASRFKTRNEFQHGDKKLYSYASKRNWMDLLFDPKDKWKSLVGVPKKKKVTKNQD